jgi:replicative DNA helicase
MMFVFREEIYRPDEVERTEIILPCSENGPAGKVKLTFLKNFTRLESYAGNEVLS